MNIDFVIGSKNDEMGIKIQIIFLILYTSLIYALIL